MEAACPQCENTDLTAPDRNGDRICLWCGHSFDQDEALEVPGARICSFTVIQGEREWQQWTEIPAKAAAKQLDLVISKLNMSGEDVTYFTTTSTGDPNTSRCQNEVWGISATQAALKLAEISKGWKTGI